jgi:hypothetical protein
MHIKHRNKITWDYLINQRKHMKRYEINSPSLYSFKKYLQSPLQQLSTISLQQQNTITFSKKITIPNNLFWAYITYIYILRGFLSLPTDSSNYYTS